MCKNEQCDLRTRFVSLYASICVWVHVCVYALGACMWRPEVDTGPSFLPLHFT